MDYIELHTRSAFSFLAGGSLPEDLVARAAALDHAVIAMGDRDGLYGAPRFHKAATQAGLRAIVGCTLTMAGGGALYLLVADRTGYRNLCRLLTDAKLRAPKGQAVVEGATWRGGRRGWCAWWGTGVRVRVGVGGGAPTPTP
ncbi:MAG: PHP domain-containing protein [Candidatus Binatia bacterium]